MLKVVQKPKCLGELLPHTLRQSFNLLTVFHDQIIQRLCDMNYRCLGNASTELEPQTLVNHLE